MGKVSMYGEELVLTLLRLFRFFAFFNVSAAQPRLASFPLPICLVFTRSRLGHWMSDTSERKGMRLISCPFPNKKFPDRLGAGLRLWVT
jgi:hypothetical protein